MNLYTRLRHFLATRQIILAIFAAIIVALVMTAMSLKLYDMDYVSRLDVSLPDRESIRAKTSMDDYNSKKFAPTGPLDNQAYSDFESIYLQNKKGLDVLGKFDGSALDNESLQIGTNE